jgi:hypothetical protein
VSIRVHPWLKEFSAAWIRLKLELQQEQAVRTPANSGLIMARMELNSFRRLRILCQFRFLQSTN